MLRRRYGDQNHHFGPFTYAKSDWPAKSIGLNLCSGDREYPSAYVAIDACRHHFLVWLPAWLLRPYCEAHKSSHGSYEEYHQRKFGLSYSDNYVHVYYGAQTWASNTSRSWCKELPWLAQRFVRFSLYDLEGEPFATFTGNRNWDEQRKAQEACPSVDFEIEDYDGERIIVTTKIQEREWKRGTGWFKWLSLLYRPTIHRSLDLSFGSELGPEKGSWKGGTTGHSIEMEPGELHEAAMRRYCEKEHRSKSGPFRIKFVGATT